MLELENGGDRSLSKVVCTGRVHAVDPGSDLRSEKLTLTFRPQAPGAPPGMFQSDGTELALIEADGKLVVVNTPEPGEQQQAAATGIGRNLGGLMKGGAAGRARSAPTAAGSISRNIFRSFTGMSMCGTTRTR